MSEITKEEAIATVEAITTHIHMINEYIQLGADFKERINNLKSAKNKIEKVYKEHE